MNKVRKLSLSLILLTAVSSYGNAQTTGAGINSASQEVIYIRGVRFVDNLLEKWIAEYARTHSGVRFAIAGKDGQTPSIEVVPFGTQKDDSVQTSTTVAFGKYAILPIAGKNSALSDEVKKKKLNGKKIRELFFEKDIFSDDYDPDQKDRYGATVYSCNASSSVSHLFAEHFGYEARDLKGKKIAGDDIYLNSAVKKDFKGVSFNNLNYVFNVESRQLNEELALLPLDVKKEYAEILAEQNLDRTITLLENKDIDLIPVEELTFVIPANVHPAAFQFLEWALSEGQSSLRTFGFLRLDDKRLAQQRKEISTLATKLLANR